MAQDSPARPWPPRAVLLGCTSGVALVGLLDASTGTELRIFPFYYLPIALGSQKVSARAGLSLALLSTASWALAMGFGGSSWSLEVFLFNTLTQMVSFGVVATLVANVARHLETERDLNRTDGLTSLPNRRAFYEVAEVLLAASRRSGHPVTVAYIDLDNFKKVNDERGHGQGDAALITAADAIRGAARAGDLAARLGGDEFAVIFTNTGPAAAQTALERLGETLAAAMKERQWPITASIGAISFLRASATVEQAVASADSLMYRVKARGKGRVLVETVGAQEEPDGPRAPGETLLDVRSESTR